jgi:PAS domain-containing protein
MTPIPRRHWLGYVVAVACVLLALGCSAALGNVIGWAPFLLFFPAVMFAAWLGGLGPGLVATALSSAFAWYIITNHRRAPATDAATGDAIRLGLFFVECLFITILNEAFHRSRRRTVEARAGEQRATQAVAQAEQRYRAFVQNSSEAIWRFECDRPIPTSLPPDEQIDRMYADGYLAECNEAMARMYGFDAPADLVGKRLGRPDASRGAAERRLPARLHRQRLPPQRRRIGGARPRGQTGLLRQQPARHRRGWRNRARLGHPARRHRSTTHGSGAATGE